MPGMDGTGPFGSGPNGRGMGPCGGGSDWLGYGRGRGNRRGRGFGWGFAQQPVNPEIEKSALAQRKAWLESQLNVINEQLKDTQE